MLHAIRRIKNGEIETKLNEVNKLSLDSFTAVTLCISLQGIGEKSFKKLLALGGRYVTREVIPYREYKTDATEAEYMCKR